MLIYLLCIFFLENKVNCLQTSLTFLFKFQFLFFSRVSPTLYEFPPFEKTEVSN